MASSTFVFVSSDSGAGVVLFTCPVLLLSYHPYVIDRVVFTFRLTTNAIAITENPVQHSRTKHIDIRYDYIKEHVM